MSTKIRICIRTAIWIILQCITFMAYSQNIGGACITSLTYTTSDASSYIVQKVYANGNMTKDRNKGISCITYNTMNLPSRIEFENGSRATYLYSADGTKLQVKYETSYAGLLASGPPSGSASTAIADIHTIDYVGDKIYEDGVLSRILIEGGYVDYSGETPIYHTYLTDHQGNVRVVVDENAAVKQVNHYYPYGALFAESTNGDVQPYKYNGKELDRMHGLDWYDHGARHNDAAIGRWHVMDPLCEKYYDVSPYAYCAGDPVNAIDPDGRKVYVVATTLPGFQKLPFATHTYTLVTGHGAPKRYAYGSEKNGISGIVSGNLKRCFYVDDEKTMNAAINYIENNDYNEELPENIKNIIEVNPPKGVSNDAFEKTVIDLASQFENNNEIQYNVFTNSDKT